VSEAEGREASEVNRELTGLLVEAGRQMGLTVATEYAVPGGRIDVVWSWKSPRAIPGLDELVPIVGFEVESSWRTRKHVKGDLLNLQDAGVAVGVIVLAGADPRDDSLRRFATALVDRPGPRMLIWTADDVRALARGESQPSAVEIAAAEVASVSSGGGSSALPIAAEHTGKYRPLWLWLRRQDRRPQRLMFADIERHAGILLPDSSRSHIAHWHSYQGSAVARAIIDAGWHAGQVDLNAGAVTLSPGPPPRRM
jgi:hypothetical protein